MTPDFDTRVRTHLANERTFLAWYRTGLTLVALGVAAGQVLAPAPSGGPPFAAAFSAAVVATGLVVVTTGLWRYRRGRERIDAETFEPAGLSVVVASIVALVTGLLAIGLLWVLPVR